MLKSNTYFAIYFSQTVQVRELENFDDWIKLFEMCIKLIWITFELYLTQSPK